MKDELKQINELHAKISAKHTESELVTKYKFDNQILMRKLSEYKKAEKGAMQIVKDYDEMKMKYFNLLQETEKTKKQVQEYLQKVMDQEQTIEKMNQEKQKHVDDLYRYRVDINKQSDKLMQRDSEIEQMEVQHNELVQKAASLIMKEKEITVLQADLEKFLDIMSQVDRHLKTLIKYLRGVVESTKDPVTIEHTQKQIKNIEKIHKDIKKTINHRDNKSEASRVIDCLFDKMSKASKVDEKFAFEILKDSVVSQSTSERQSLEAAMQRISILPTPSKQQVLGKRQAFV